MLLGHKNQYHVAHIAGISYRLAMFLSGWPKLSTNLLDMKEDPYSEERQLRHEPRYRLTMVGSFLLEISLDRLTQKLFARSFNLKQDMERDCVKDGNTLIKTIIGMISGFILECSGIYFIYAGITSVGTTSVQILGFTISAGSIGIVVIFIGAILQYATITHNSITVLSNFLADL
jgi:hypothetical protein